MNLCAGRLMFVVFIQGVNESRCRIAIEKMHEYFHTPLQRDHFINSIEFSDCLLDRCFLWKHLFEVGLIRNPLFLLVKVIGSHLLNGSKVLYTKSTKQSERMMLIYSILQILQKKHTSLS